MDNFRNLWSRICFHGIDASIAIAIKFTGVESQENAPEQLRPVFVPPCYDAVEFVEHLTAEAEVERIAVKMPRPDSVPMRRIKNCEVIRPFHSIVRRRYPSRGFLVHSS